MSNYTETDATAGVSDTALHTRPARRLSTETKSSYKTTELIAYVVTVIAVLIASALEDNNTGFDAQHAWFYVALLTIGYMISRGLAKSGSREPYTDDNR
jgi:uncharacterized membrane protein YkgB